MSESHLAPADHAAYQQSELYKIRHSAAHVMAQAVLELYPQACLAIGPPIENGFYYDFDLGLDDSGSALTFKPVLPSSRSQLIRTGYPSRAWRFPALPDPPAPTGEFRGAPGSQ